MARFTNITKVDTPYIPVDLDQSRPKMMMYQQLKDERDQITKVAEQDALTKLKYSELLSKVSLQDYNKASQLFDNYLNQRTQQILNAKDNLSLSAALNSSGNFLSNPEFQRMTQDYEAKQAALQSAKQMEAQGRTSTILNSDILNQSGYDEQGNRRDYTTTDAFGNPVKVSIDQLQAVEVQDYQTAMADFGKKVAEANSFAVTRLDQYGNLITQTGEILSPNKLENIANRTFTAYLDSEEGKAQLRQFTTPSTRNPNPLTQEEAVNKIKNQYKNVLKSLAYSKTTSSEQPSRLAIEAAKKKARGNDSESGSIIPTYGIDNIVTTDSDFFDPKSTIITGRASQNQPNQKVENYTSNNAFLLGKKEFNKPYGKKESEPQRFSGTFNGYLTAYQIEEVRKGNNLDSSTKDLKGTIATTGRGGTIEGLPLDYKPEPIGNGRYSVKQDGKEYILVERGFKKFTTNDEKDPKTILEPIENREESLINLDGNFTNSSALSLKQAGNTVKFEMDKNMKNSRTKVARAIALANDNGLLDQEDIENVKKLFPKEGVPYIAPDRSMSVSRTLDKLNRVIDSIELEEISKTMMLKKDMEKIQNNFNEE